MQAAQADGFSVDIVDDSTWDSMTAAQFAKYQLVIVGDPTCDTLPQAVTQNSAALSDAVMARAGGNTTAGNRVLIGTDPVYHFNGGAPGAKKLIDDGIAYAGLQTGATGLYLDISCFDEDYNGNGTPDAVELLLPKLTVDNSTAWTENQDPPCGGDVSLISKADQFSDLSGNDLRGWECSVHETFPQYPTDWNALAIATDTDTHPTCGTDVDTGATKCGEAYILIAGSGIVSKAPNLDLSPATGTSPVGTPYTLTATVTDSSHNPLSGVVVSFSVTGVNGGASGTCAPSNCTSGADGKVTFTYTGTSPGDDTVNAAITVNGSHETATAKVTWTAATGECFDITDLTGSWTSDQKIDVHMSLAAPSCADVVYDVFIYDSAGDTGVIAGQGMKGDGSSSTLDFSRIRVHGSDGDVYACGVSWRNDPNTALDSWGYSDETHFKCVGLHLQQDDASKKKSSSGP